MPQKRLAGELSSSGTVPMNSDPVEAPPSSVLAAPPMTERISLLHQQGGSSNQASPLSVPRHRQNGTELTGFRNISGISGISGVSTIDAPLEADRDRDTGYKPSLLPTLTAQASAPHQIFDTSQLHRHPEEKLEVYANAGFRPQQGDFGTPAPLPASSMAQ